MANDKSKAGSQDSTHINMTNAHQVYLWAKEFGVTVKELAEAVKAVGPSVEKVR